MLIALFVFDLNLFQQNGKGKRNWKAAILSQLMKEVVGTVYSLANVILYIRNSRCLHFVKWDLG